MRVNLGLPAKRAISARIVVVDPPPGVTFALQRGRRELGVGALSTGRDLSFDFAIQVDRAPDGSPRFSGEFVQGPAGGKFVYVNSGTLAGQAESLWTRRAKVTLQALKWAVVDRVASQSGSRLEVRITGTARYGGPACASVPLLDGGWAVKRVGEARATRR